MNNDRPSVAILEQAIELQRKKGRDYNNALSSVEQADYYEHGVWTLLDVIKTKYLRIKSVLETIEQGGEPEFESVQDSCLDLINYASFLACYMNGDVPGQKPDKTIFNKKEPYELIPSKFKSITLNISQSNYISQSNNSINNSVNNL